MLEKAFQGTFFKKKKRWIMKHLCILDLVFSGENIPVLLASYNTL